MAAQTGVVGGDVSGIDGKVVANTTLFTTENGGERWYTCWVIFKAENIVGLVQNPNVNVGTNSASFNNIIPVTTPPLAAGKMTTYPAGLSGNFVSVPANTDIVLRVAQAANATTYTFRCWIMGFYA